MDGALSFAFLLGIGTFFSPCAVALVPSYAAYFVGTKGKGGLLAGLRFGAWAGAGVVSVFLAAAAGLYLVRQAIRIESADILSSANVVGLAVGVAFILLGALVVAGRAPSLTPKLNVVLDRTPRGMFLWGVLFSLGSLGCSLPLALAALSTALASGAGGLLVLAAYAAGLVVLVVAAGPILGVAGPAVGRLLTRAARPLQVVMGVVLLVGGAYVAGYYALQMWG